jgi:hypothetical protein
MEAGLSGQGDEPVSQSLEAVLHDVRSAFRKQPDNRANVGALLDLYGSIISLCARAQRIRAILAARSSSPQGGTATFADSDELALDDLRLDEVQEFDGFYQELLTFGRCLTAVNFAAIDIYFPGLRDDLLQVTGVDLGFSDAYVNRIAPKYGLANRELPTVLVQVLDRYSPYTGPREIGAELISEFGSPPGGDYYAWGDIPTQVSVANLQRIIKLLEECRTLIRGIVQDNWKFRDLLDRRQEHEGGIYVGEIEYNVSGSQVGAVGPGAHVHNVSFQQQVHSADSDINASVLATQLETLQAELAKQASERDHYAALVAVSDAAADAREGKTASAVAKLAVVGRWVADIASKIGVSVAAEAIKQATGLG